MTRSIMAAGWLLLTGAVSAVAQEPPIVNSGVPPPDCTARVNYDRNADLPGYRDSLGICQPFTPLGQLIPGGYQGDFYTDNFTDAKIRERWQACKADESCAAAARCENRIGLISLFAKVIPLPVEVAFHRVCTLARNAGTSGAGHFAPLSCPI